MITTTLELKEPLIYTNKITKNTEFKKYFLTDTEFEDLNDLQRIFDVFYKPTTRLQGEYYTTLPFTLLYIFQIYTKLDLLITTFKNRKNIRYNSFIIAIKRGIGKLEKYYPRKITTTNLLKFKPYLLAILLDPRLKLIHFQNDGLLYHYSKIEADVTGLLKQSYYKLKVELKLNEPDIDNTNISFDESTTEITTKKTKRTNKYDDDDDEFFLSQNIIEINEVTEYFKESTISNKDFNPLDYWKQNTYRFPILSILARRYLAIPATSASIERVFSIGSDIITKRRNRLLSNTVKQLILLKRWKLKDLNITEDENEDYTSQEED